MLKRKVIKMSVVDDVVKTYDSTGSIKETALVINLSEAKVKKILVSSGKYQNEYSIKILELHNSGKTTKEISESLKLSEKAVNGYLPYCKAIYNLPEKSENAKRIDKARGIKR